MASRQLRGLDSHISERYNKNLLGIFNSLLAMGGMVEDQLSNLHKASSVNTISKYKEKVEEAESQINEIDISLHDAVIHVIATHQPIASDLRLIIAAVKIATELERIGDEIDRCYHLLLNQEEAIQTEENFSFENITQLVYQLSTMLHRALDAFGRLDIEEAHEIIQIDRKIDKAYTSLNQILLASLVQQPERVSLYFDLMSLLRSLERAGDHITNMVEHLVFIITGTDVRYMSTKKIRKVIKHTQ